MNTYQFIKRLTKFIDTNFLSTSNMVLFLHVGNALIKAFPVLTVDLTRVIREESQGASGSLQSRALRILYSPILDIKPKFSQPDPYNFQSFHRMLVDTSPSPVYCFLLRRGFSNLKFLKSCLF